MKIKSILASAALLFFFSNIAHAFLLTSQEGSATAIVVCYMEESGKYVKVHEADIWVNFNGGEGWHIDSSCPALKCEGDGNDPCAACLNNLREEGMQITGQSGGPYSYHASGPDFHSTQYTLEGGYEAAKHLQKHCEVQ